MIWAVYYSSMWGATFPWYVLTGCCPLNLWILLSDPNDWGYSWPIYFPCGSDGKVSVYNVGDLGSIPGSGRFPGEENGNILQYSCLENPMDGEAWCRLLSMESQRVGQDWVTSLSFFPDPSAPLKSKNWFIGDF